MGIPEVIIARAAGAPCHAFATPSRHEKKEEALSESVTFLMATDNA
jgi:hypothetical protein